MVLVLAGAAVCATVQAQSIDEYQVKAAFLYNFAKFVEWPPQAFKDSGQPITICVLGQSAVGTALEQVVHGKTLDGRPFAVVKIADVRRAQVCQILFVSATERKRSQALLADLDSLGILTVGEMEGFAVEGGIINFKLEGGRVRLEINVDAAEQSHLRISSKLLSLAQIVKAGHAP
jgi:hypothetical protein